MRYSFRKLFLAKFSLVFFAAAVVFLTACDSPVSLGKKVPLPSGGPEVNIPKDSPESQPGSFLQGSNNPIQLDVDRKNGIRQVEMEIEYYKDGIKQDPKKIPATWDEDLGKYVADIDTSGMDDGQITVRVIAEDNNGNKTITTDIIYTVKNKPSYVAINIPGPKGSVPENVNEYGSSELTESEIIDEKESFPEVVIGDFVLGMFEDIAGLEQGYPQIKVWQGEDEPSLYTDNAGWENVSRPDLDGSEGWVPMDVGTIMSDKVERGGTFRYYLRRRYPDGTYMAKGNDLPISKEGAYHIKLK
ncbi:MAG: hypothetical protein FWH41_09495, partial [Treponema sp.]|nr:hypothetical protein [Treponema sp.]